MNSLNFTIGFRYVICNFSWDMNDEFTVLLIFQHIIVWCILWHVLLCVFCSSMFCILGFLHYNPHMAHNIERFISAHCFYDCLIENLVSDYDTKGEILITNGRFITTKRSHQYTSKSEYNNRPGRGRIICALRGFHCPRGQKRST